MSKQTESGIEKSFQMMMQMRQEDKIRDEQREKERLDREERKEERWERERREKRREDKEREARLLQQLKDAQPVVPQTFNVNYHNLPKMSEGNDVELFLRQFEISLRTSTIPQNKWKENLLSQLTVMGYEAKQHVIELLEQDGTEYDK